MIKIDIKNMKAHVRLLTIAALGLASSAYAGKLPASAPEKPLFSHFVYTGQDEIYQKYPLAADEFYTPILQGCYPDPSICRKGNDYYMACSSFAVFPGVPVFHSTDLVNWEPTGHALERPTQLKLQNCKISEGIYAPTIRYNPYNDTFYMITTHIGGGMGNIIVKTSSPEKGWSDPVKLNFDGIDPSIFFDDNGKAYVVHNDAPEHALYEGHRVIKIWEYDIQKDQVIAGTDRVIVNGGTDINKKPIWIEAPHLYKKGGKYYLMCAEGGTGDNHSEVVFISDNATGPYVPAEVNPILSQRHLPANRPNKVEWAGHADVVETPSGDWYGVFLAVRPNECNRVNTGRETFILPVDWSGKFPVFKGGMDPLLPKLKMPEGVQNHTGEKGYVPNANFTFSDDLTSTHLDSRWVGIRDMREKFITTGEKGLQITPYATDITEAKPTSTLFFRQQHNNFTASVELTYTPASEKDLAGMVCYQNESFNYIFGVTRSGKDYLLLLQRTDNGKSTILGSTIIDISRPLRLQIKAQGDKYTFSYSTDGTSFHNLGGTVSGDILSTNVAGGFTGNMIGLYATSANMVNLK